MGVTSERIRLMITDECLQQGIAAEHIQQACEHADALYRRVNSITTSVLSGIALAEELHHRAINQSVDGKS